MDSTLKDRIMAAMNQAPFKWRTVRGIAKEVGARDEIVEDVLAKSGSFVRAGSPSKHGEALYSTIERYQRETPLLGRVLGAAANTVAG